MKTIRQALNALAREHAFGWEQADANDCARWAAERWDIEEETGQADLLAREIAEAYEKRSA